MELWKITIQKTEEKDKLFKTTIYELFVKKEIALEIINKNWKPDIMQKEEKNELS